MKESHIWSKGRKYHPGRRARQTHPDREGYNSGCAAGQRRAREDLQVRLERARHAGASQEN